MSKKVLMIGLHPDVVDYDKYPGLTPEKLESALRADETALKANGYDAAIGFIRDEASATEELAKKLSATAYDVVLIGAGVRKDDDQFLMFERLVNLVHEHAPQARICFNTCPTDTQAAVERWA
ncbi:MAG: hypothetical protein AAGG56_00015 [Pseudomonadota bacterium]